MKSGFHGLLKTAICNIGGHVVGPLWHNPSLQYNRKEGVPVVSSETALDCIGPEWASVGRRQGPIKFGDLPRASKTGMPKVHLF